MSRSDVVDRLHIEHPEDDIDSIFAKLGLCPGESETHRRVAAVLAFLSDHTPGAG